MNTEPKPWYSSKTIWAALAVIAIAVLQIFRVAVDDQTKTDVTSWFELVGQVVAGLAVLVGRLFASRKIGPTTGEDPTLTPAAGFFFAALAASLLLGATGCTPAGMYVAADRATYEAVAPEYLGYVAADPAMTADQKNRRRRTLETWRLRLEAAEQSETPVSTPASGPASQP